MRGAFGLPADAVVVGFVGRFTRDKGIAELLRAFQAAAAREPRLRLLMVGDHDATDPLPESARRAGQTSDVAGADSGAGAPGAAGETPAGGRAEAGAATGGAPPTSTTSAGAAGAEPSAGGAGAGGSAAAATCRDGSRGEGATCESYCSAWFPLCKAHPATANVFADQRACLLQCAGFSLEQLCCRGYHVSLAPNSPEHALRPRSRFPHLPVTQPCVAR